MTGAFVATLLVTVLSGVLLLAGITIYNRLVTLGRRCDRAAGDIDVQLNLRLDLVPALVETVKGYAGHERATLEDVIRARASAVNAPPGEAKVKAQGILDSALSRLMMLAEAYPDLKAEQRFAALHEELAVIEHRIAAARRFLNAASAEYNTFREQFPANIVAGLFDFPQRDVAAVPRDVVPSLKTAPAVRF